MLKQGDIFAPMLLLKASPISQQHFVSGLMTLLPNETLAPGFPRRVSVDTARKWMHELGFSVRSAKKSCFVYGHERDDVVEYRKTFLRKLVGLGF